MSRALSHLLRVTSESAQDAGMTTLIEACLDSGGDVVCIRTCTLASSARWLLLELCRHSLGNEAAVRAIAAFAGLEAECSVPTTPEECASLLFKPLLDEIDNWFSQGSLTERRKKNL